MYRAGSGIGQGLGPVAPSQPGEAPIVGGGGRTRRRYTAAVGSLLHLGTGERALLWPSTRIGRALDADIPLEGLEPRASREHALVHWTDRGWRVRDLGTRNGTSVQGRHLRPGEELPLVIGVRLAFGGPGAVFEVEALEPPEPAAVCAGAPPLWSWAGALVLPDPEHAKVVIQRRPDGRWWASQEGVDRPVEDRDPIDLDGRRWTLRLPGPGRPTEEADHDRRRPRAGGEVPALPDGLVLHLDTDDTRVTARIGLPDGVRDLGQRAHHRVLHALAREREHARRKEVPAEDAGWLLVGDVATWLGLTAHQTYVLLFRLREQLDREERVSADALVERRPSGEIRLADVPIQTRSIR